jgi:uncharacterized surface protein with fasciclin (FAS1) repeats
VSAASFAAAKPKLDIVDTAVSTGQFKTLVAAVTAAGLVTTLKGEGPFTVFAPTDAAFEKLPARTVQALLNDIPTLTKILTYHVLAGEASTRELLKLGTFRTLQGEEVTVSACDGKLYINDAEVVMANVKASNGIIQVIDTVLMPK